MFNRSRGVDRRERASGETVPGDRVIEGGEINILNKN
jgi:hypothetical protein